ncbi:MAG: ferric uptake regulator family protein [Dorea sp.]|jgi:Fur family ferric uptake transcriptional regulator|nr:ferric uptake regulator family protein [Dorea sp.]GFI42659.1 ferric uptake regulation protein [Lachnospiraceae bacterium]
MSREEKIIDVITQLKENGHRITAQRKLLLEIILENEYSSCKEIYFAAKEKDQKMGMATVYRMVQLLEDMELIHKEMVVRL